MTTINSSSPASIWLQAQSAAPTTIQTPSTDVQTTATVVTDSVQLSDAALAKLDAELTTLNNSGNDVPVEPPVETQGNGNGNEPPVGTNSSGSGNDFPTPPLTPLGGGNGNEIPIKV